MIDAREVRRILDAATRNALSSEDFDAVVTACERHENAIRQLTNDNRALRDALDLCRTKFTHLEVALVSLRNALDQTLNPRAPRGPDLEPRARDITRPQPDLAAEYTLSPDARRILAGLAAEGRGEFWSNQLPTLSRGLGQREIELALDELLDNNLIEELSYTPFEGTHYGCTTQGREVLRQITKKGR